MFRKVLVILFVLLIPLAIFTYSEEHAANQEKEITAIKQACMDYVEGYYDGHVTRIENGVHAQVVKRRINDNAIKEMTRDTLIEYAKTDDSPKPEIVVNVYDVYKDIALAKVTSDFVDYCQLAKIDGKWQVINVLWSF